MAHFHPLRWEIDLRDYQAAELDTNPVVQAVFTHEYVHYVQVLTGTIGRHILIEMARIAAFAGIHRRHGWPPPGSYEQVNLEEVLRTAAPADFQNTAPRAQYHEFAKDLSFALADDAAALPQGTPVRQFVRLPLTVGTNHVDDFVHITAATPSGAILALPITDRVVFENMARQVQRNFLRFNNNLDTSRTDVQRRAAHGDLVYVCLHDALVDRLPASEDAARWTITLCQVALSCRNPGTAFEHVLNRLNNSNNADLPAFVQALGRDSWFAGEFNVPPVQEVLRELIEKWGSAILPRENWQLREFTKLIANACNAVQPNYSLMAEPLLTWAHVGRWVRLFGCPPVIFADGRRDAILGVAAAAPWLPYLRRLDDLMQ